ncbi:MAG: hypothetical protein AAFR58_22455 [Cyanobacteria bacterium J06627_28]
MDTNRITVGPQVHFCKPCAAGTRLTVQNLLEPLNENRLPISFETTTESYNRRLFTPVFRVGSP